MLQKMSRQEQYIIKKKTTKLIKKQN